MESQKKLLQCFGTITCKRRPLYIWQKWCTYVYLHYGVKIYIWAVHCLIWAGLLDKPVTSIAIKSQNFVESRVHYYIHKNLLLEAILSHMNPVQSHTPFLLSYIYPYVSKVIFNNEIFELKFGMHIFSSMYATWPTNLILLVLITLIHWKEIMNNWQKSTAHSMYFTVHTHVDNCELH